MAESIRLWLTDYIRCHEAVIGKDKVAVQVAALNEMFRNGQDMTPVQFREVMTTAHFDVYFSDALSRMFYDAYQYRGNQWARYTYPDQAPDFRDVRRMRMSEPGSLSRRREMRSAGRATYVADSGILYGVEEFSREFGISWQTILNDDLGQIRQVPQSMLRAATRFEDSFVSALYDNATTQASLVALGATYAGTGRLTEPNLATGVTAMRTRTDAQGNKMQITKIWLVICPELEIQALKVLESLQVAGSADNDKNVIQRYIAGVITDHYIATSGADQPWYLFADPSEIPGVPVVRLNGWPKPVIYKQRSDIEMVGGSVPAPFLMGSYETGEIVYTVETVIGGWDDATYIGVGDYRGIYYSSGTTA